MTKALIVSARAKDSFDFGGLSVRWKVEGNQTAGRFFVVHHPTRRTRSGHRCTITITRTNCLTY